MLESKLREHLAKPDLLLLRGSKDKNRGLDWSQHPK
jgi:hypothetical protein